MNTFMYGSYKLGGENKFYHKNEKRGKRPIPNLENPAIRQSRLKDFKRIFNTVN